ncbi:MAG: helix-turn-helix domain-containing protein [Ectothiorhodospiraceae bacterium]
MNEPMLTSEDVARLLGCSKRTVRRLVAKGQIPRPLRIGRLIRWQQDVIVTWMAGGCPPQK